MPVLPGRMFDKLDVFEIGWKNIFLMLGTLNQINYLKHLYMHEQFVGCAPRLSPCNIRQDAVECRLSILIVHLQVPFSNFGQNINYSF